MVFFGPLVSRSRIFHLGESDDIWTIARSETHYADEPSTGLYISGCPLTCGPKSEDPYRH